MMMRRRTNRRLLFLFFWEGQGKGHEGVDRYP
jgi:hypothetical protein